MTPRSYSSSEKHPAIADLLVCAASQPIQIQARPRLRPRERPLPSPLEIPNRASVALHRRAGRSPGGSSISARETRRKLSGLPSASVRASSVVHHVVWNRGYAGGVRRVRGRSARNGRSVATPSNYVTAVQTRPAPERLLTLAGGRDLVQPVRWPWEVDRSSCRPRSWRARRSDRSTRTHRSSAGAAGWIPGKQRLEQHVPHFWIVRGGRDVSPAEAPHRRERRDLFALARPGMFPPDGHRFGVVRAGSGHRAGRILGRIAERLAFFVPVPLPSKHTEARDVKTRERDAHESGTVPRSSAMIVEPASRKIARMRSPSASCVARRPA